jgi:orotate phosphoribosyltransferase
VGGGLLDLVPAQRGHFAYTSGDHGDLWLDLDALFVRPRRLRPYVAALVDLLPPCDVVCGPLTGGAYLAELVADATDTRFAWTEGRTLTGPVAGRRVVIVDDAINAGSAVSAAAEATTTAGAAQVVAVAALLTLGAAPATVAGVPVCSLATVPSQLWPPATCPACAAGAPLSAPPA